MACLEKIFFFKFFKTSTFGEASGGREGKEEEKEKRKERDTFIMCSLDLLFRRVLFPD